MRLAILTESPADDQAVRILADAVLGIRTVAPTMPALASRGWPSLLKVLPSVAFQLHYADAADGLIVVADSNHQTVVEEGAKNRRTALISAVARWAKQARPAAGRPVLKIAVGVASPAIEAWFICSTHPEISEQAWEDGLKNKREPYSKQHLKAMVYGMNNPSLPLETEKMVEASRNLVSHLPLLEQRFPNGFGSLAAELRRWRSVG